MGSAFSYKKPAVNTRDLLNRALALCSAKNFYEFYSLVDTYAEQILFDYDDFFFAGTQTQYVEEFLTKLVQLDGLRCNERIAGVHARCLRDLHVIDEKTQRVIARVICSHYGRAHLQRFLDTHLTRQSGFDPAFRANMRSVLLTAMRVAASSGDEEHAAKLIQIYCEQGVSVNKRYKADDGESALHFATSHGMWKCEKILLEYDANPDLRYNETSARELIQLHRPDFLEKSPAPKVLKTSNRNLFTAIKCGDETQFAEISPEEANQDDGWCTLLQAACSSGKLSAVLTILAQGGNTRATGALQDPPILLAAENGYVEIVLALAKFQFDELSGLRLPGSCDVNVVSDHGNTILHLLARTCTPDHVTHLVQLVKVLAARGELDLHATNVKRETPFKLLMELMGDKSSLFPILIHHGAFLGLDTSMMQEIHSQDLQHVLDSAVSSKYTNKGYKVATIDYECFQLKFKKQTRFDIYPEMLTLYKISKSNKHTHLLVHPVITSFLHLKWLKIYWIYFINLILHFCYLVSLTTHVSYIASGQSADISRVMTIIFWTFILIRELLQLAMSPREYLKTLENSLHVLLLILTLVQLTTEFVIVSSILILVTYAEFSLLLGRHPSIAMYVAMFLSVSKVNILLLAISAPFLFSFAVCFNILFRSTHTAIFNNTLSAFFRTFVMATGELDIAELDFTTHPVLSEIIVLLFVVSIEVILMNLLHALAVHDTEGIQHNAQIVAVRAKIQLYTRIEAAWLGYPLDWYSGSWGDLSSSVPSRFWQRVSASLKTLVHISVLPLKKELNNEFRISIREDGHVIGREDQTGDVTVVNLFPGPRILTPLIELVSGVSFNNIFTSAHEYMVNSSKSVNNNEELQRSFASDIASMRQELTELRLALQNQLNCIERLTEVMSNQSQARDLIS